jgi:hypothetical protein
MKENYTSAKLWKQERVETDIKEDSSSRCDSFDP